MSTTVTTTGEPPLLDLGAPAGRLRVDAGDGDVAALTDLLRRGARVGHEHPATDLHLNEVVPKPWGSEHRAYCDDFVDVWQLRIDPGHSTSLHAHPRKTTYLLVLEGTGQTRSLRGTLDVTPGCVLRIARGAFHATACASGGDPLVLVEVETPRNKLDLLRLQDGYQRAGTGYERVTTPVLTAPRRVKQLPGASLCRRSPCGRWQYDVLSGMDVHYRRRDVGRFLVPLGIGAVLADDLAILTDRPDDDGRPQLDSYYLCIRPAV